MRIVFLALWTTWGLAQPPVEYRISFDNADHHEARVEVRFSQLPAQPLELRMSRTSPGRYALHEFAKNVYELQAFDSQGRRLTVTRTDPHQWDIAGHTGEVRIEYTLYGNRGDGTYVAIDNVHAHLNIPAAFVWARGLENRPIQLTIVKPQAEWKIATQLTPQNGGEIFTAPNLAYFLDSPIEVSDHRLYTWSIAGESGPLELRLALHHAGTPEEGQEFVRLAQAIVDEAVAVYGAPPPFDNGNYVFLADYLPQNNGDGMEHRNSTVLTSPMTIEKNVTRLLGTVAHEFFHVWNVERLRPASLEPFDLEKAPMSGELWFAEGFTSYYDDLILYRAGLTHLDRFAGVISRVVNTAQQARGRRLRGPADMSRLATFFDGARWLDPVNRSNTFLSYYGYGNAIALGLDLILRSRSDDLSLDRYMQALWQDYGRDERPYTNSDLMKTLSRLTGDADFARRFFDRYVFDGELPDFEALLSQAGLLVRPAHPGEAWVGPFSLRTREGRVIIDSTSVVDTPFYRAGLERGDVLLKFAGEEVGGDDWKELLKGRKPGEQIEVEFEKNGVSRVVQITLEENPAVEVVPFEHDSRAISPDVESFRRKWLGPKAARHDLRRRCPKCSRQYPFANEYCPYDGERLRIDKPAAGDSAAPAVSGSSSKKDKE